jgi:CDP-glycerol glycerophosphotransferase
MKRIFRRVPQLLRKVGGAVRAELQAFARRGRLRRGVVLYESFAGNGVLCNPEAIFRDVLQSSDLAEIRHIWVLDSLREHRGVQAEFAGDRRVRFVRRHSLAYVRALATSQFLVNNATFPMQFSKRSGQIYLNTWHGTPLKRMGYDMPDGAFDSANTLRNFVAADFLLSQNSFMTEQMYEKAYKLRGAFRGLVIEEGYPRVDRQFLSTAESADVRSRLEGDGIEVGDRSVILFAPTWKGTDFSSPADDAHELFELVREIQEHVGREFLVLLKTHQVVHRFAADRPEFRKILVSNDLPTNLMLGITDLLVTDYSSIFFDFLPLDRPLIFFTPDDVDYSASRGLYFPLEELPGPVARTVSELGDAVLSLTSPEGGRSHRATAADWRDRFTPYDDGGAAGRIVDVVFRGLMVDARTKSLAEDPRTSMLLSLGGMRSNGITNSALNLLGAIDHSTYDISVVFNRPRRAQQLSNQQRIPHEVRQFHRVGGMNGSKLTHLFRRLQERHPALRRRPQTAIEQRMWRAEWARCFGDARFESVVEFSGYTAFWASVLLHSPNSFRSIWLHNDLSLETSRFVGSRRRMKRSLPAVFSLYQDFDSLVSVSESLNRINRAALGPRYGLPEESFVFARNLVDEAHVREGLSAPLGSIEEFELDEGEPVVHDHGWIEAMQRDDGTVWFVTVGRFSPEKNQARLIRAFAEVYRESSEVRLVIVGHGPLRGELQHLIDGIGLSEVAFVVGPFANPFPVLAAADCFVLSSNYEGQPMVLLEAALAKLPIVSVEFDSALGALPDSAIRIVPQSDQGLAEGMRAFLSGAVVAAFLDGASYNREALAEFCEVASPRLTGKRMVI